MNCFICNQKTENNQDKKNPFTNFYSCRNCGTFYIEPIFMRKLELYEELHGRNKNYNKMIQVMQDVVSKNNIVVFTNDIDNSISKVEGAIFIEFRDITDLAHVFINDISRGSDYGD